MKICKLERPVFIKKTLLGITLMLLTCGVVTSTHAIPHVGTGGTDSLSFWGSIQTVNTTFFSPSSGQNLAVNGTFKVNLDTYDGLDGYDILSMSINNDFLLGTDVQNIELLLLGDGDDALNFSGHTLGATFLGGQGNDIVITGSGEDIVYGSYDNDFIDSGAGDDTVHGNDGNDTIFSGLGNDIVNIGSGADRATGGLGNDIFHFDASDSLIDTITDLTSGDILDLDAILQGFDPATDSLSDFIQFSQQGANLLLSVSVAGLVNGFEDIALLENVKLDDIMLVDVNSISQPLHASANFSGHALFGLRVSSSASVPEPSMLALLGIGLIGFMRYRRYK